MKVLMFNGSPKAKGCTYTALEEMAKVLNEEGIETEIMHVGAHPQGSWYGLWQVAQKQVNVRMVEK